MVAQLAQAFQPQIPQLPEDYQNCHTLFPIPATHTALEEEIRSLQASNESNIPEERLTARVSTAGQHTLTMLLTARQMKDTLRIESLSKTALSVTYDKARKDGRPERALPRILKQFNENATGRETMLRVLHVVSNFIQEGRTVPIHRETPRQELLQSALYLIAPMWYQYLHDAEGIELTPTAPSPTPAAPAAAKRGRDGDDSSDEGAAPSAKERCLEPAATA